MRIKGGWRCFNKYKELLTDKEIPLPLRGRIFDQCALTTMTYGAETWSTTKEIEQKLRTTQRAMERRMLNLTLRDKIRHSDIRQITQVKDVISFWNTFLIDLFLLIRKVFSLHHQHKK